MANRRQIREAAVQMLYWLHVSGGQSTPDGQDRFWQLISESARRHLLSITLRTARHLGQGRDERLAEWTERLPIARASAAAAPDTGPLLGALDSVATLESRLSAAARALDRLDTDLPDDQAITRMQSALDRLLATSRELEGAHRRLFEAAEDHPTLTPALEPVFGPLRRLARANQRLRQLDPDQELPEQPAFDALHKARNELTGLREGAEHYVAKVRASLDSIDARLSSTVDNYSPERIDPVDRAILRLATWEILEDPDVPKAVAINEAVEIARRMGTEDSARFVNGVLDHLARDPS